MKKLFLLLSPFLLFGCFVFYYNTHVATHPLPLSKSAFNVSLGIDRFGRDFIFEKTLDDEIGQVAYQLIDRRSKEWKKESPLKIPLEIHQIFVGKGTLPDDLARAAQSVRLFHKDVPYTLWTEKEYAPLLQAALGKQTESLPKEVLRDVVAALILLKKGGVVMDLETECVQPITPLLSLGDCIIGFEPPLTKPRFKRRLQLSSSVIAAAPAHPLIAEWLHEMLERSSSSTDMKPLAFYLWATQDALTSTVAAKAIESGEPLLVGPTYFCPINPANIEAFQSIIDGTVHHMGTKKILRSMKIIESPPYADIARETICIHIKGGRQNLQFKDCIKKRLEAKKQD